MASEQQIHKKNLEAELATIRDEIDSEVSKLSIILSQKDAVAQELKTLSDSKIEFEKYKKETSDNFETQRKELVDAKARSDEEIGLNKSILSSIKSDIKEAIKELAWVNDKIMNAESHLETLSETKSTLDEKIAELLVIVAHKEEEEKKLKIAQDSRLDIESSIERQRTNANDSVSSAKLELKEINDELSVLSSERDRVQSELKTYTDQLYTAMNDWHTVRTRLEIRFKEHYPELEIPLMA